MTLIEPHPTLVQLKRKATQRHEKEPEMERLRWQEMGMVTEAVKDRGKENFEPRE